MSNSNWSDDEIVEESDCETPKRQQISNTLCPSPPRKKKAVLKSRDPPPGGYFNPPELELIFAKTNRRASCA
ncbi:hypothetical protein SUGI_0847380 [Cryptomeria japonica]|nr:hypothetical protein SUGI_0847380 [Cryptomeria japonica]